MVSGKYTQLNLRSVRIIQINGQIFDVLCSLCCNYIQVTKAELDDFKIGKGIPNCVLEARPLVEPIPRLLCEITLNGVKPPYNELTLRLPVTPSRKGKFQVVYYYSRRLSREKTFADK
jgi:hypothetical protein